MLVDSFLGRFFLNSISLIVIGQPKCPLTDEWINMWYIYTMEYYSTIKKNEIMPFSATRMGLEIIVLSEVRQRKTNIISLICGI